MSLSVWHMAFHDLTLYSRPLFLSSNCEPIVFISSSPTFGLERFSITVQRIILLIHCQMFPHLWFFPESFSEDRTWTLTPHLSCLRFSYGVSHTVRSYGFGGCVCTSSLLLCLPQGGYSSLSFPLAVCRAGLGYRGWMSIQYTVLWLLK